MFLLGFTRGIYSVVVCIIFIDQFMEVHSFVGFSYDRTIFISSVPLLKNIAKFHRSTSILHHCLFAKKHANHNKKKKNENTKNKNDIKIKKDEFSSSIDDKRILILTDKTSPWFDKLSILNKNINTTNNFSISDHTKDDFSLWYQNTRHMLLEKGWSKHTIEIHDLPYIYKSNDKRHEKLWLKYMQNDLRLDNRTFVIAHAASADAILRYLEEHELRGAILISASPFYHAAERHGRQYHFSLIKENCKFLNIIYHKEDPLLQDESIKELDYFRRGLDIGDYSLKKIQYKDQEEELATIISKELKMTAGCDNLINDIDETKNTRNQEKVTSINQILLESQLFSAFEIRQLKTKFYLTQNLHEIEKIITDWLFIEQFNGVKYE